MAKLGNRQLPQQSGSIAKLEALGKKVEGLIAFRDDVLRAMRHTFTVVEQRMANIEDIVEALVYLTGRDAVEKKVQELHVEKLENKSKADKAALDAALAEGRVAPADVVGETSIVIGGEVDKDGNALHPLRVQQLWQGIQNQEMKTALLGKKVGDVIDTSIGTKFTVTEIYNITMKAKVEAVGEQVEVPVTETEQVPETPPLPDDVEEQLVADLDAEIAKNEPKASN